MTKLISRRHGRRNTPNHRRVLPALICAAVTAIGFFLVPVAPSAALPPCQLDPEPAPDCPDPHPPTPTRPEVKMPTSLQVSEVTSHSARLSWSDHYGDATQFVVTRSIRDLPSNPAVVDNFTVGIAPGQTDFVIDQSGLPARRSVEWRVVATAPGKRDSAGVTTGTMTVTLPASGPAADELRQFRADWRASAFTQVNAAEVLADAARIVAHPRNSIAQMDTGACGPAAVEFELVARQPGQFVRAVHSIADTGGFNTADGTRYAAHEPLRTGRPNPSVSPANWLFMATLKDSANAVRITGSTRANDTAWISSPADVDNWLAHVVGFRKTTATAILRPITTGKKVMPKAVKVMQSGGAVVLLVDSSIVGNKPGLSNPNHYVNLLDWSSTSKSVTFTTATWGGVRKVHMSWSRFDSLTWDVLTAQ